MHDNQIYGLTKGQTSPTSDPCSAPEDRACNRNTPFNPLLIALAAGATFAARSLTGDPEHLAETMKAAIRHPGYALVDILQPCVSFNKRNTFAYYKERVYRLDASHDAGDRAAAMIKAMEFGDRIPIGILYRREEPTFHQKCPVLASGTPLVDWERDKGLTAALCREFV